MNKGYRNTGYFFAVVFALGAVISTMEGFLLRQKAFIAAATHPFVFVCFAVALLMLLSARVAKLAWIQPIIWYLCCLLSIFTGAMDLSGIAFFIVGTLLLFRFGFFEKSRVAKITITLAAFYAVEIGSAVMSKNSALTNIENIFLVTILLVTLYVAYREKLMVYLKEPKPQLSLTEKGLSDAEKTYVLAINRGLSPKEVAFEYEVSESTIRNTLARAYKKLDVTDRSGLAALAERCEIHE